MLIRRSRKDASFASRLRDEVRIQSVSQSASGVDVVDTWTTIRVAWAAIQPLRGREFYERDQVIAEQTHTVSMRWEDISDLNLSTKHRLKHGDRLFGVMDVRDVDERHRLALLAVKEQK